jgi:hypothetical protein
MIGAMPARSQQSPSARVTAPRREDRGDLIALYLRGTYDDMGEQQVRLLGDAAAPIFELRRTDWRRLISSVGVARRAADVVLANFWAWCGPRYEQSGYFHEIRGIARGLRARRVEAVRAAFGWLGAGSTVFLTTRSATADGSPILAKNSDWPDGGGLQRPLVSHYFPTNGDLAHVTAGWPLLCLPGVGLNEAGFAISLNFFIADQIVGLGAAQWPLRRALQRARSVGEGIAIFRDARLRGISGFVTMADAAGEIAMVECTPRAMQVYRPEGDWFVQTNHARTARMRPRDRGLSPDTMERFAAIDRAVRERVGGITPAAAADILRDRSNGRYLTSPTVANIGVLNSVVVQPSARTLWHATSMQPHAPFGEFAPFSPAGDVALPPPLVADGRFGTAAMRREADVVGHGRLVVRLLREGRTAAAARAIERLRDEGAGLLEPERLAWASALVELRRRALAEADALLVALDDDGVAFDLRLHAIVARALLADARGTRADAVALYRAAAAYMSRQPYNHQFLVGAVRQRVADGLRRPQRPDWGALPDLQRIP